MYQVEYAEKNVARGSFAVGAVAPDGVALAAVRSAHARSVPGAFLERRWRERVHRVDDTIACVACGLVPDALQLLAALRDFCRRHRSTAAAAGGGLASSAGARTASRAALQRGTKKLPVRVASELAKRPRRLPALLVALHQFARRAL